VAGHRSQVDPKAGPEERSITFWVHAKNRDIQVERLS
jgi:hypothetical protein